ncbi:hypothetical protein ACKWTF_011208 [Chironomus riparius]
MLFSIHIIYNFIRFTNNFFLFYKNLLKFIKIISKSGRLALSKKGQLDADHRALLYNIYNHPYGAHLMEQPKRNFDEIDRLSDFEKRNFDEIDRMGSLYDFKKRNFDEIDRMGALTDF